ncbi:hypothetical protein CR513_30639, partial [Mucuna pruriens]
MVDAICRWGPWSVEVLPCRSDEIVCKWATEIEEPLFYLYETLFSKLGIRLPFTNFEQVALRALNDHFFRVAAKSAGRNLLFGDFGEPLFPLYWSNQPAILVTVDQDHLESWEEEFVVELNQLPTLSYSKLISAKGHRCMRARSSLSMTLGVIEASLLAVARLVEEKTQPPPVVVLESVGESPLLVVEEIGGSSAKRAVKAGALQSQE